MNVVDTPNINTREYWNRRFGSGDWEEKDGPEQTAAFATEQVARLGLAPSFSGSILDFGCGLGDAMPIYAAAFPNARLMGVDISEEAVALCKRRYGHLATFVCGTAYDCPPADVIIASNVVEHLDDHLSAVRALLDRCDSLFVTVPYRERLRPGGEHINTYDEHTFDRIAPNEAIVFFSKGWSQFGLDLLVNVYLKNFIRPLIGRPRVVRGQQVMYRFRKASSGLKR